MAKKTKKPNPGDVLKNHPILKQMDAEVKEITQMFITEITPIVAELHGSILRHIGCSSQYLDDVSLYAHLLSNLSINVGSHFSHSIKNHPNKDGIIDGVFDHVKVVMKDLDKYATQVKVAKRTKPDYVG